MWCKVDNFVLHLVRFWVLSRRDELHRCWKRRQESHFEASLQFLTPARFPNGFFCHSALRLMLTLSGVLLGAKVQSVWITYFHFSMHCRCMTEHPFPLFHIFFLLSTFLSKEGLNHHKACQFTKQVQFGFLYILYKMFGKHIKTHGMFTKHLDFCTERSR